MAQIDTRHDERNLLFQVLIARHYNDFDMLVANIMAKMEKDDVDAVMQRFGEWKQKVKK